MNNETFKDKVVLVTGGTGSFGQKFTETLLKQNLCKKIIIFSRDEFKQHEMAHRIHDPENKLRFFLGDIRDLSRVERAFSGVDIVVHAAALKQVPALEFNPLEAIKTNVLGTQNIIDASLNKKIKKVVLVSTDKAVNPINLYGATKLCAEKLMIAANAYRTTSDSPPSFSVVRYGNVVGSRGSIVEVLKNQKDRKTATLTHPDMTRFWITLDKGVELVMDALSLMKGGEIFIPKLPAMKVSDLISTMIPNCEVKV
ncbi:MAG: SDR family NAD(P)-dependent oxidoreductase, partial [Candidatus Pacebacteria bacterium]|nr:SDR family NAD(P)-dependent oxidoreductase [Candidatus Paceibacterota bacterium]